MTDGGSEDDDERISRSSVLARISALRPARVRMSWCIVGTAVYQEGCASCSQPKTCIALKPGEHQVQPPAPTLARTPAIRPWMWKSGMMLRQRSSGVSESVSRMWAAEAHTLRCRRGTILGREVVPEVCRTRATSSASAAPGRSAAPEMSASSVNSPAGRSVEGISSTIGMPRFAATSRTGDESPRCTRTARASRSER